MNEILIKEEEMKQIISKLESQIKDIESIYTELDNKLKEIDGSNNIWTGSAREAAYEKYKAISSNYTSTINQIKALKIFLETALSNYLNGDEKLNESIENNKEELDVN